MQLSKSQYITRTAVLCALAILFQMMRLFLPGIPQTAIPYLVGTLVNTCLLVSAFNVGLWSGLVVSVLTPMVAAIQGFLPTPILVPFIAGGNALLVLVHFLITRRIKKNWVFFPGAIAACAAKFVFLLLTVSMGASGILGLTGPAAAAVSLNFSYPQIITGVLGTVVALPICFAVRRIDGAR